MKIKITKSRYRQYGTERDLYAVEAVTDPMGMIAPAAVGIEVAGLNGMERLGFWLQCILS